MDAQKPAAGEKARFDWIDAAKGIGILLVVIGHIWTRGPVRDAIYAFHMPLFFLLSGYVFRPLPPAAFARALAWSMALPYAAFLLTIALADQAIERARDHLPIFRSWGQAVWSLLVGGSELSGPFTIFWFIPCLAVARLIQNGLWNRWPDPCDGRWVAAMAAALVFGVWIGGLGDFSPLGLLALPVALVLLWIGALWRCVADDRIMVTMALVAAAGLWALTVPVPINMKAGDYGRPIFSLPLAVLYSMAVAAVARMTCLWHPARAVLVALGRRSLVIMYCHVAIIHYGAPYFAKPLLLLLAIPLCIAISEMLTRTRWGRAYFLGKRSADLP